MSTDDKAAEGPAHSDQCEHDGCRVRRGEWTEGLARVAAFGNIAPCPIHGHGGDAAQTPPVAAPAVIMDQRGNYWRVYPKGTLPGASEDMLSICSTTTDNYDSEAIATYRQGRDLSAQQAHAMLARIEQATDDPLLLRAAQNAVQAWTTGRDMVTEGELLLECIALRLGVEAAPKSGGDQ